MRFSGGCTGAWMPPRRTEPVSRDPEGARIQPGTSPWPPCRRSSPRFRRSWPLRCALSPARLPEQPPCRLSPVRAGRARPGRQLWRASLTSHFLAWFGPLLPSRAGRARSALRPRPRAPRAPQLVPRPSPSIATRQLPAPDEGGFKVLAPVTTVFGPQLALRWPSSDRRPRASRPSGHPSGTCLHPFPPLARPPAFQRARTPLIAVLSYTY